MARLLKANRRLVPSSFVLYLRDALPDDYLIVADPTVYRQELQAVLLGPYAMWVLHARDWAGIIYPDTHGPWRAQNGSGEAVEYPNPQEAVVCANEALQRFLRDEYPHYHPAVRHLLLLRTRGVRLGAQPPSEPVVVTLDTIAETVMTLDGSEGEPPMTLEERETLAMGLRDRHLTHNERATVPFTFRTGNRKAWTIEALVQHMDRHPEDGVYHLRNGTIERWLREQGAEHLADLSHEILAQRETDPRVQLEAFLIGTGLVERPKVLLDPPLVDFGYLTSGEIGTRRLRLRKGRGRGYLYGSAQGQQHWLEVEPSKLSDGGLDAVVTVRTDELYISDEPHEGDIYITCSASEIPVHVPVRLYVRGVPSPVVRQGIRPLAAALLAGIPGLLVGAGIGASLAGVASGPGWLRSIPDGLWPPLVALLWGGYGFWRGRTQPAAWPFLYGARRWFPRLIRWGAISALLAVQLLLIWMLFRGTGGFVSDGAVAMILIAFALGVVPAALRPIETGSAPRDPSPTAGPIARPRSRARVVGWIGGGMIALFLLFALVDSGALSARGGGAPAVARWIVSTGDRIESGLNGVIDDYYLRRFDRRAPETP